MIKYAFELTDFALSDEGIHLLRSRYNYKTIAYHDVDKAFIKRGPEIKNPLLSLLLGIALLSFSIVKSISLYQDFNDPTIRIIYIESILLPLFPALIGFYFVYTCIRKGPLLQIEQGNRSYKLSLREVQMNGGSEELKRYLRQKLSIKLAIEDHL